MSDDLISWKAVIEENVDKVRVSSAEIVVHGTKENPYYEIEYFDLSDNEIHIGFSSYKLDVVFGYLEKYFDIVNEENKSDQVQDYHSDDLISRKAAYKAFSDYLNRNFIGEVSSQTELNIGEIASVIKSIPAAFDKEKVIKELREELNLSDAEKERCARENPLQFDSAKGYANGIANVIEIVEKGGLE